MALLFIRGAIDSNNSSTNPTIDGDQSDSSFSYNDAETAQVETTVSISSDNTTPVTTIETTDPITTTSTTAITSASSVEIPTASPVPIATGDNEGSHHTVTTSIPKSNIDEDLMDNPEPNSTPYVAEETTKIMTFLATTNFEQLSMTTIASDVRIIGSTHTIPFSAATPPTTTTCHAMNSEECTNSTNVPSAESSNARNITSVGQIIGIVVGIVVFLVLTGAFCLLYRRKKAKQAKYLSKVSPFIFSPDEDDNTIIGNSTKKLYSNNNSTLRSNTVAPFKNTELPDDAVFYSNSANYRRGSNETSLPVHGIIEPSIATPEELYHHYKSRNSNNTAPNSLSPHVKQLENIGDRSSTPSSRDSNIIADNCTVTAMNGFCSQSTITYATMRTESNTSRATSYMSNSRQNSTHYASVSTKDNHYRPSLHGSLLIDSHQNSICSSHHQRQESSLDPQILQQNSFSLWDDNLNSH